MGLGEAGSEWDVGLAGALRWWCGVAVVPLREWVSRWVPGVQWDLRMGLGRRW